jgi:hypothetical protein
MHNAVIAALLRAEPLVGARRRQKKDRIEGNDLR